MTARKDDLLHRMSQYDNDGRILTHAEYAAKFPPREGYTCGKHSETFGGGCFNCGWKMTETILTTKWSSPTRCQDCGNPLDAGESGAISKHVGSYGDVYIDHLCLACAAIRSDE